MTQRFLIELPAEAKMEPLKQGLTVVEISDLEYLQYRMENLTTQIPDEDVKKALAELAGLVEGLINA